jgi:hypothetical protein
MEWNEESCCDLDHETQGLNPATFGLLPSPGIASGTSPQLSPIALVLEESKVEKVDCFCFRHIPGLFYQSTFWGYLGSPKPTPVAPIDQCATPPLYSFLSVSRTCSSFFIQQRHMWKESVHVHAEGE